MKERKKTGREESDEKARQGKVMSFVLRPCKVAPTVPPSLLITSVAVMYDTALHTQSASLGGGALPVHLQWKQMLLICGWRCVDARLRHTRSVTFLGLFLVF